MTYNKPEIAAMGSAVTSIQSGFQKGYSSFDNTLPILNNPHNASSAAYEADE